MQYRKFGNTGMNISALGFGCMRLPEVQKEDGTWEIEQEKVNAMMAKAYELGINYFDLINFIFSKLSLSSIGIIPENLPLYIIFSRIVSITSLK